MALWVAKELGLNRFVTEQPPYNLLDRRVERELIPMALTYGLAILPWSPLAAGFLTGKYRRGEEIPAGARLKPGTGRTDQLLSEPSFRVLEAVEALAAEKGCTPSQLALAWVVHQPGVTSPIIGPRTLDQLEDNLGALEVTITDEDRTRLDAVAPPGKASSTITRPISAPTATAGSERQNAGPRAWFLGEAVRDSRGAPTGLARAWAPRGAAGALAAAGNRSAGRGRLRPTATGPAPAPAGLSG